MSHDMKKSTGRANTRAVLTIQELQAMVDKYGAAADVHAGVEDLRRRLASLGPAKTDEEANSRWIVERVMLAGITSKLSAKAPNYDELRQLLGGARNEWSNIVVKRDIEPLLKFRDGRKSGTGSPIRKAIARLLKKNPAMSNADLWKELSAKLPKKWQFYDNSTGKYVEGRKAGDGMNYNRFRTVASEERRKFKE